MKPIKNNKTFKKLQNKFKTTYYNTAYAARNYFKLLHKNIFQRLKNQPKSAMFSGSTMTIKPVDNADLNVLLHELNLIHYLHHAEDQLMYLNATVNDLTSQFCVDTGAAVSILGKDYLSILDQFEVKPFPSVLRTATSTPVEVFGRITLPINISGKVYHHEFVLASTPKNFLGADF